MHFYADATTYGSCHYFTPLETLSPVRRHDQSTMATLSNFRYRADSGAVHNHCFLTDLYPSIEDMTLGMCSRIRFPVGAHMETPPTCRSIPVQQMFRNDTAFIMTRFSATGQGKELNHR